MRSHSAIASVLSVLAVGLPFGAAQSLTTHSGLSRRVGGFSDFCGFLGGSLEVPTGPSGVLTVIGRMDYICICLSYIPTVLVTDPVAKLAVKASDASTVASVLADMLTSHGGLTCEYPANAIQICHDNNICGYTCGNGFSLSPQTTECVCQSPNGVCNGQCTSSCPSNIVTAQRRAPSAFDIGVVNPRRRSMCPRGFIPCGIFEQRGQMSEPWDCVDIRHELESCGGCMTPFDSLSPRGVDCTAIPGVADVSCIRGSCVVRRCTSGYTVTADHSQCTLTR